MDLTTKKTIQRNCFWSKFIGQLCKLCNLLFLAIFICFFSYILFKGCLGIHSFGFKKIFGSWDFNLNAPTANVSFWSPLLITLFLSICVLLISLPFAKKCAIWLVFFAKKKWSKKITFLLQVLSAFPAIVFALFTRNYISFYLKEIFGIHNTLNIASAIFTLFVISTPILINLLCNEFKNHYDTLAPAMALGINKRQSVFKCILPQTKKTIGFGTSIVFNKIISESTALTFLLSGENYDSVFQNGFFSIFSSKLNPIAPLISENFFSEGSGENGKNLLFAFGFLLLITSWLINNIILLIFKSWNAHNPAIDKIKKIFSIFKKYTLILPIRACFKAFDQVEFDETKISFETFKLWIYNTFNKWWFFNKRIFFTKYVTINKYFSVRFQRNKFKTLYEKWNLFLEKLFIFLLLWFALCLFSDITINALGYWITNHKQVLLEDDGVLRALWNTVSMIVLTIFVSVPIAIGASMYWSEYNPNSKFKKIFFGLINMICSVPSIIFGIFGLSFFIYRFGITSSGSTGRSLLAGIMTLIILILPYLIKIFHSYFSSVDNKYRLASYAAGVTKLTTFATVIWPMTKEHVVSGALKGVTKIIGETGAIYLTAGLNNMPITHIMYPGQTLTTRIYAQLFNSNLANSDKKMYESAFIIFITIFVIVYIVQIAIPSFSKYLNYSIKTLISYRWLLFKMQIKKIKYIFKHLGFSHR